MIRKLAGILILILTLTVSIGPMGRDGLSQLTGLEIESGTYTYVKDLVIVIAVGRNNSGVRWKVRGLWHQGVPVVILLHEPEVEL